MILFRLYSDPTVSLAAFEAYTIKYVSAIAAGGGDGDTPTTPYTLSEAVANVSSVASRKIYRFMDDGAYSGVFTGGSAVSYVPSVLTYWDNENGPNFSSDGLVQFTGNINIGNNWCVERFNLDASATIEDGIRTGVYCFVVNCKATHSANPADSAIRANSGSMVLGCQTIGGRYGVDLGSLGACFFCDCSGWFVNGIESSSGGTIGFNKVHDGASANVEGLRINGPGCLMMFNTFENTGSALRTSYSGLCVGNILENMNNGLYSTLRATRVLQVFGDVVNNTNGVPVQLGSGGLNYVIQEVDPLLTNPAANDYSLQSGSPARNLQMDFVDPGPTKMHASYGGHMHEEPATGPGAETFTGTVVNRGVH